MCHIFTAPRDTIILNVIGDDDDNDKDTKANPAHILLFEKAHSNQKAYEIRQFLWRPT